MLHDGPRLWWVDATTQPGGDALASLHGLPGSSALLVTHHQSRPLSAVDCVAQWHRRCGVRPARERSPNRCSARWGDHCDVMGLRFEVLDVARPTAGRISPTGAQTWMARPPLFCGDTLFPAAAGASFEGTLRRCLASLDARLAALLALRAYAAPTSTP